LGFQERGCWDQNIVERILEQVAAILSFSLVPGRLGLGEVEEDTVVVASSEHMKVVVEQSFAALGLDDKLEELDKR
jgi:hypothetical protein